MRRTVGQTDRGATEIGISFYRLGTERLKLETNTILKQYV